MVKINYKNISSIEDIRRKKKVLKKYTRYREKIIIRRFNKFKSEATPVYFYEQFIKTVNLQDSVLSVLPHLAKLGEPLGKYLKGKGVMKKVLPLLGGVGVGLIILLAVFKKKMKQSKPETSDADELFI